MDERDADNSGVLPLEAEPPPLRMTEGGAIRVGASRITLDLIVREYQSGKSPEEMVRAYDTLALADVYAVIAYFLRHRTAVEAYLKQRDEEAAHLRSVIESRQPARPTRETLLERRAEKDRAEAG